MGANMFFLAISNNLPILVDNINMARREYQAAIKAGQQATPVWKQLLGGIVSWQTALVVGITLLTVYGKEITAWTKSLFGARQSLADPWKRSRSFRSRSPKHPPRRSHNCRECLPNGRNWATTSRRKNNTS